MRSIAAALFALLAVAGASTGLRADDAPSLTSPTALNGQIEATQLLPGGPFSAVKLRSTGEIYFLSANGRFVIKGAIYDLWGGKSLGSYDEIALAAQTVNLAGLKQVFEDLQPFVYGEGPIEIIAFVDPKCPYCAKLFNELSRFKANYTFKLVTVPFLGDASTAAVKHGFCAEDRAAALRQLLSHGPAESLPQRQDCDLTVLQRRMITTQVLGIQGVPYLIHADGRYSAGLPPDLDLWLTSTVRDRPAGSAR